MSRRTTREIKRARAHAMEVDPWAEAPVVPTREMAPRAPVGPCGRVCHASEGAAMKVAHRWQNKKRKRFTAYRCAQCDAWHLTDAPKG